MALSHSSTDAAGYAASTKSAGGGDNKNGTAGSNATQGLGTTLATQMRDTFNGGPHVFNESMVSPMGQTTQNGLNQTVAAANAGQGGLNQAYGWAQGLLGDGGFGQGQTAAMDTTNGLTNRYGNIARNLNQPSTAQSQFEDIGDSLSGRSAARNGFMSMYNDAANPSLTEQQLMNVAQGGAFGENAPGYKTLRTNALNDALGGVGSSFLTNGRFGSSVMGDAAGTAATNAVAGMDYQNYQNDIGRQERALSSIEQMRQQGFNNQSSALSNADAARLNQINTRMSAIGQGDSARLSQINARMGALGAQGQSAQTSFGMGQQGVTNAAGAAAAAPSLYAATLQPGQAITAAGQTQDAANQQQLLGRADLFDRTNNAQSDWQAKYLAMLGQLNGQPGTQEQTPWWQSALSGATSLAGAFL